MRYGNGDVYIGHFINDLRCTLGTLAIFKLQNGSQYIGAWKDDERLGVHQFIQSNGVVVQVVEIDKKDVPLGSEATKF